MIYTTLNKIRSHGPCKDGWEKLLSSLRKTKADDDHLSLAYILESNGIEGALWCLRTLPELDNHWRLLAVKFARAVEHLMADQRSIDALDIAERHALGEATDAALDAARAAAWDAARDAARSAARDAARSAAWDAAWDAARAAAWDAARAAAWGAARAAARDANKNLFLEFLETIDNA